MLLSISEILERVETAKTETDKVRILQENRSQALIDVLQGAFDSRIKWLLPEGKVPYKPSHGVGLEQNLYQETRRLPLFVEGGSKISQTRREQLFIELLEYLTPKDAVLLEAVKDKKIPYASITPELFKKAFPEVQIVFSKPKKPVPKKKPADVENTKIETEVSQTETDAG